MSSFTLLLTGKQPFYLKIIILKNAMNALLANYVIRFLQLYVISVARDTLCFYVFSYTVHWIWKRFLKAL